MSQVHGRYPNRVEVRAGDRYCGGSGVDSARRGDCNHRRSRAVPRDREPVHQHAGLAVTVRHHDIVRAGDLVR